MALGARTPEELEALLEDAVVVGDEQALRALLDSAAVVVDRAGRIARGPGVSQGLRAHAGGDDVRYYADPRVVLQSTDVALVLSPASINVIRRGSDRCWRLLICYLVVEPASEGDA